MNLRSLHPVIIGLVLIFLSTACASNSTPSVADQQATNIAMGVSLAQTRTALAPTPTRTAIPTHTPIPPTATATPTKGPVKPPVVSTFASCWWGPWGPGNAYHLESNIEAGEQVQVVGIGSVPGWYIIINPYFYQRCWIQAANLSIDPNMDLTQYPIMTPIPLGTPNP